MTELQGNKCDRCGVVGQDRRTLWMSCLYAMNELGLPFTVRGVVGQTARHPEGGNMYDFRDSSIEDSLFKFFTLTVCKGCRSEWMGAIKTWFRASPDHFNSDSRFAGVDRIDDLAALAAEAERLKTDLAALNQRMSNTAKEARRELDEELKKNIGWIEKHEED